jgi:uncharacterized protein
MLARAAGPDWLGVGTLRVEARRRPDGCGKFELYTDKTGKFRFRLKAANGEVIASSEAYESKAGARNGIESVRNNAPAAELVEPD